MADRVTQVIKEVLEQNQANARVTQVVVEVLRSTGVVTVQGQSQAQIIT